MAIRQIREEGDEILKKKSREVEVIDDKIRELLDDMYETMKASNDGIGLAAPQVGILKRVVVIDLTQEDGEFYKLINPSWSLWPTSQNCFVERTSGGGNGNAQAQNKWIRDNTICYVGDGDIEIITFVGGESKITTSTCSPNWSK